MTSFVRAEYLSVGGNRNSGAADWSTTLGLVAFGADQNVGIWAPSDPLTSGTTALLISHTAKVTAVKFLSDSSRPNEELLVTGCASGELAVWAQADLDRLWTCLHKTQAHDGTLNTITCLGQSNIIVTGGADAKVKIWRIEGGSVKALATVPLKPRFMPLTLAIGPFPTDPSCHSAFLVVGGTRNDVQVYSLENVQSEPQIKLCAILTGHEAWVRSVTLTPTRDGDFLLASASQDKYVRIWRFHSRSQHSASHSNGISAGTDTLTAKVQKVSAGMDEYSITFEALLLGHEDWIYSAAWSPSHPDSQPQLLTASADGSLSIWEADSVSGIWISISRLGEISGQKGATTATGSSGGFWTGLWGPDGKTVTCLGRTGSWRIWYYDNAAQYWTQKHGLSGHTASVNGISWSPCGSYLLSTSCDQTTRLHAEWNRGEKRSWHEFSRPQIHGYDLNCITSTSPHQFCSGADEKLLRVFNEPRDIANMLHRLCGVPLPSEAQSMPDTAAIPVLGLSNKAMDDTDAEESGINGTTEEAGEPSHDVSHNGPPLLNFTSPPSEDLLSRHTLWPEHEKLYGHGSEISEATAPALSTPPSDNALLATACKASSFDHAVIRLYDTNTWSELKPPLSAHSLTVTRLSFSPNRKHLLSVGRDRQWAVFRSLSNGWTRVANNSKAHTRMILDATWLDDQHPRRGGTFLTAGRDKTVKIWTRKYPSVAPKTTSETKDDENEAFEMETSLTRKSAVSAISTISLSTPPSSSTQEHHSVLAIGEDSGALSMHLLRISDDQIKISNSIEVPAHLCPSKTVNRLMWRPRGVGRVGELAEEDVETEGEGQLAVASADGSVRILRADLMGMWKMEVGR